MKRMLFFVNPNAGHGGMAEHLMEVVQRFTLAGYAVTVYPTSFPGETTQVVAKYGNQYEMIVTSGGDGTFNETVSGLMQLEHPPVLGYLPSGTVNDVASSLGIPTDVNQAANVVVEGRPMAIDVGNFDGRWFTYVAAFGAFTDVAYTTPQTDKRLLGRLAYLLNGAMSLADIRPVPVTVKWDGGTIEDQVLFGLVSSTTSVGGFKANKKWGISLSDGLFEVVLVKHLKNILDFPQAAAALLRRDFSNPMFYSFQASQAEFTFHAPVPWTLDGEFGGNNTSVVVQNHRQAITVMVPGEDD